MSTYLYGSFDCMFLFCHVGVLERIYTLKYFSIQSIIDFIYNIILLHYIIQSIIDFNNHGLLNYIRIGI